MLFTTTLYVALVVFLLGFLFKISSWCRIKIGDASQSIPASQRAGKALQGILATIFSPKIGVLLKIFVLDVLLLRRVYRESLSRWLMHMLIFWGFMLLMLMHALEKWISAPLFSGYYSTVNPYLFLRNLFGVMVLAGVAIAIWRRVKAPSMRLTSQAADWAAIVILAVIMLSGFALEANKIISQTRFMQMAEEYAGTTDQEELKPLKAFWAKHYGVVFSDLKAPVDEDLLENGREMNGDNCAECHSRPHSAFVSYPLAKAISPLAKPLADARLDLILWYIHFLACFAGLAYLPFSKLFHIYITPLSLLTNAVMDPKTSDPANLATLRAMELDACVHCAICTEHCSVGTIFRQIPNLDILPSEKLAASKAHVYGKLSGPAQSLKLRIGSDICTSCLRCTNLCPAGINLQDLWLSMKEDLTRQGQADIYQQARNLVAPEAAERRRATEPLSLAEADGEQPQISVPAGTFRHCFECQTCTNVCPVVANFENPMEALGLLPHQIMHSLGLGLVRDAMGADMTWNCLTCYQCQEQCPQKVPVADLLYELRNKSFSDLLGKSSQAG